MEKEKESRFIKILEEASQTYQKMIVLEEQLKLGIMGAMSIKDVIGAGGKDTAIEELKKDLSILNNMATGYRGVTMKLSIELERLITAEDERRETPEKTKENLDDNGVFRVSKLGKHIANFFSLPSDANTASSLFSKLNSIVDDAMKMNKENLKINSKIFSLLDSAIKTSDGFIVPDQDQAEGGDVSETCEKLITQLHSQILNLEKFVIPEEEMKRALTEISKQQIDSMGKLLKINYLLILKLKQIEMEMENKLKPPSTKSYTVIELHD